MARVDQRPRQRGGESTLQTELDNLDLLVSMAGSPAAGTDDAGTVRAGAASDFSSNARAPVVNRTHRVVRERAQQMRAQRSKTRGLVVPLLICSALLLMMSYALWTVLAGGGSAIGELGELQEEAGRLLGVQAMDADGPLSVLFFWFVPVSAVVLGTVLFRRSRGNDEAMR